MRASDYLGPTGPLASAIPGYEHRPSQMRMADAVEEVLEREGVLLVEAGTGTGKTLAYLLPALFSDRKVVVSTGTRTLQDQIMDHDLPMLERHLGRDVHAACMKGLANYLCLRRFEEARSSAAAGMHPGIAPMATGPGKGADGRFVRQLAVVEQWRERTRTGDRAELDLPEDAAVWSQVASSSETRIGPRCDYYEQCFVTNMRREAEQAQLVIVNHHLFFADLATRGPHGGGVIPDYDVVIFDEAHQLEDVATQFFGVQVSSTRIERLVRDAQRVLSAAGSRELEESMPLLRGALEAGRAFFSMLPRPGGPESGRLPISPQTFAGEAGEQMMKLDSALEALAAHLKLRAERGEAVTQMARRAQQIRDDLATIADTRGGGRIAWAQTRGRSTSLGASPVDVSDLLREELFYRTPHIVLTSATLSTRGHFEFIKRRLGIDFDSQETVLPSPFDYASQAALYVPAHMPDPRAEEYVERATHEVADLVRVTGGGAFVLCTSFRMMHALAERVGALLEAEQEHAAMPILVQGEAPKATLLERFRAADDAVLFATASFWEGVDVPGWALRLVIIDKLPFGVPTDPLIAARCDRVREQGEQPFMKYLVPSAALALKQGFGRLIRGRRDRGIVAILDSRIVRKGYGRVFLDSLPSATRCDSVDEVRSFWARAHEDEQDGVA